MKPLSSKSRISFVCFLCFIGTFLIVESGFSAETETDKFPNRPITFIVSFPPGTTSDVLNRVLVREVEKYLGQPVVVVNKTGGGGSIGHAAIATAKPDGYTIGNDTGVGAVFITPHLEKLPYHPLKDFKRIMTYAMMNPGMVVKASSPFKSFKNLITYARENPKKVTYGTNSPRSLGRLVAEQIARKENVQLTHIPYKGATEYNAALLGEHIFFTSGDIHYSLVESKEVRILLFYGEQKFEEYTQIPIIKDLGYDIPCPMYQGIMAPRGIPEGIVKRIEEAFNKARKEPAFINVVKQFYLTPFYLNSRQFEDYAAYNYEKFGKILKEVELN